MKKLYTLLMVIPLVVATQAQTVPVTFSVDMNFETVAAEGVHVAGNFQGWDPAGTMLSDDDMDGIFTVTVDVADTLGTIQYKFLNGNAWGVDEACPEACAFPGSTDRYAAIDGATDLPVVCFGACAACGITTVLFKIDMSQEEAINPVGVHMNGNFNGWDGSNFLMMEDGDGDHRWGLAVRDGERLSRRAVLRERSHLYIRASSGGRRESAEGVEGVEGVVEGRCQGGVCGLGWG